MRRTRTLADYTSGILTVTSPAPCIENDAREAPTQCRFVASRRLSGRLLVTSRGGGGLWTSILFECCVCERWSGRWTSPGRVSYGPVSRRESGVVLVHSAGGLVLSSVMRGSKAYGSKYLSRTAVGAQTGICDLERQSDRDGAPGGGGCFRRCWRGRGEAGVTVRGRIMASEIAGSGRVAEVHESTLAWTGAAVVAVGSCGPRPVLCGGAAVGAQTRRCDCRSPLRSSPTTPEASSSGTGSSITVGS